MLVDRLPYPTRIERALLEYSAPLPATDPITIRQVARATGFTGSQVRRVILRLRSVGLWPHPSEEFPAWAPPPPVIPKPVAPPPPAPEADDEPDDRERAAIERRIRVASALKDALYPRHISWKCIKRIPWRETLRATHAERRG